MALGIVAATLLAVAAFNFGLIRPQFTRLDSLPVHRRAPDRHRRLHSQPARHTQGRNRQASSDRNRMAAAPLARQQEVQTEWARLNETIANCTGRLQTANAQLAEIDEKRRRFADISHELRTPLTVILMEAQIGKKGSPTQKTPLPPSKTAPHA
ncbi:histidine kinase dimerization/phospho-acceptor domain-containing protein [Roseobacter sp.]|uniref:histidine kinase dimerization/phospho-acceptor domain-containing protein n=1 Tax=Roseobacter sp. TaxID=1907202 RepID=UPI0029676E1D|nr:histidine kinase dimerization/phospho-acceptor domain-containing protein [Roseobacter sp.]MDW3183297.1 histidine kinase dimerization/phospho-acceptor domain-containing protein [Roseobacter sp.]